MNKKYLIKYKTRWVVIEVINDRMYFPFTIHITQAKLIAANIGVKCLHSFDIIYDYFGGTSKVNDYNPYSEVWQIVQ